MAALLDDEETLREVVHASNAADVRWGAVTQLERQREMIQLQEYGAVPVIVTDYGEWTGWLSYPIGLWPIMIVICPLIVLFRLLFGPKRREVNVRIYPKP